MVGLTKGTDRSESEDRIVFLKSLGLLVGEKDVLVEVVVGSILMNVPGGNFRVLEVLSTFLVVENGILIGRRVVVTPSMTRSRVEGTRSFVVKAGLSVWNGITGLFSNVPSITGVSSSVLVGSIRSMSSGCCGKVGVVGLLGLLPGLNCPSPGCKFALGIPMMSFAC